VVVPVVCLNSWQYKNANVSHKGKYIGGNRSLYDRTSLQLA